MTHLVPKIDIFFWPYSSGTTEFVKIGSILLIGDYGGFKLEFCLTPNLDKNPPDYVTINFNNFFIKFIKQVKLTVKVNLLAFRFKLKEIYLCLKVLLHEECLINFMNFYLLKIINLKYLY